MDDSRTWFKESAKEKLNLEETLKTMEYAAFNSHRQIMAGMRKKVKFPAQEWGK